jgi:hypothetical protein
MEEKTIILITTVVTAFAAIAAATATAIYTVFTSRLWTETKRQAETAARQAEIAERQAITAQQMLDAAHRPWLSIALYADAGTMRDVLNIASVFKNYGNVPAAVTNATMRPAWEGKTWGESNPLVPNANPSNLCIFPGEQSELRLGIPNVSFAPWPKGGWLRVHLEITYRGAFEDRTSDAHRSEHSRSRGEVGRSQGHTHGRGEDGGDMNTRAITILATLLAALTIASSARVGRKKERTQPGGS